MSPIISSTALPPQYGKGSDGNIIVYSGTVNIDKIYEDDVVAGVRTKRGAGKGLNHGAGTYDPQNGAYISAVSFIVETGASLSHSTSMGTGGSNKNGIIWIGCIGNTAIRGAIMGAGKGFRGGIDETTGSGPGGGPWNAQPPVAIYGDANIGLTTWINIYGSGGGGGNGGSPIADGGAGGCAIRIYSALLDVSNGNIISNGDNGQSGGPPMGGGGAGGSGGSIYIETLVGATLGTNRMTCLGGAGGSGAGPFIPGGDGDGGTGASYANLGIQGQSEWFDGSAWWGGNGGAGSPGRIHVVGPYSGSTSNPPIA